jgi:hypothetical protein
MMWHMHRWHAQQSHWSYLEGALPFASPSTQQQGLDEGGAHQACRGFDFTPNPSCPKYLTVNYLASAGFGHQFTELLFALFAADKLSLSYAWSPMVSSTDHGDDYSNLIGRLGLENLFAKWLHAKHASTLAKPDRNDNQTHVDPPTWFSTGWDTDKRELNLPCNSVLSLDAWFHCHGVPDNNCFWAPEHEFLFQRYADCLRAGVRKFGTAFRQCVLFKPTGSRRSQKVITVVWHIRMGDVVPHKVGHAFYARVLEAISVVAKGYQVEIFLVGGGNGGRVSHNHVSALQNMTQSQRLLEINVSHFWSNDITTQFIAMMQADVLIGSGSSLPQVAALLSGIPVFFNHEPKHGYGHGMEATWDTVDMRSDGQVLDSLRRIRIMLFDRIERAHVSNKYYDNPCRLTQAVRGRRPDA